MFLNLFKTKKIVQPQIRMHQINVKVKKNKNVYPGQILSIEDDTEEDEDGIIDGDNSKYYLSSYKDGFVSNKISVKENEYCENYDYGIVRGIENDIIDFCIICEKGYLQRFKVDMRVNFPNGSAFIIKNGELYNNGIKVGIITDERYNNQEIYINSLEDNERLIVFIKK